MIDEQLRILKFMNEMTTRGPTQTRFAQKVDLTSAQLMHHMHELVKLGYLKKVGERLFDDRKREKNPEDEKAACQRT